MHKQYIFFSIIVITSFLTGCTGRAAVQVNKATPTAIPPKIESTATTEVVSKNPLASCPVTAPQVPAFVPPAPYDKLGFKGYFWYGSNSLWTVVPSNGVWGGLPFNPSGYTQKILFWRDGYIWIEEPEPNLIVTGERLDIKAPLLNASTANGSYAPDIGSAMIVGADFPTPGCWKITGKYKDAELSFVAWITP